MYNPDQTIWLEETKSTNDYIKTLRKKVDLGEEFVVAAKNQTSGRGQTGNSWIVEPGMNLTFSVLLMPDFIHAEKMFIISQLISVVVVKYLNTISPGFAIKWPNDIYYNDKKIGGILVENQLIGPYISHSIIGVGLNINQKKFPEHLPNPISLYQITGQSFSLQEILNHLTSELFSLYESLDSDSSIAIEDDYRKLLYRREGFHAYKEGEQLFKAKIQTVETDGQLVLVTTKSETKKFYFKEVEFVL